MEEEKHTILIVDDNRDGADTLAMLLRMNGHKVLVAYDTLMGFTIADEVLPRFIFHDVGMPEIDGYEAARRLRKNDKFSQTVLVAVTAYDATADRRRAKDAGFDIHLSKPVEIDDIRDVLGRARSG